MSNSEVIITGVDALIALLKKNNQIDVDAAAKTLKYPVETVQNWVDFLVEEKIVGIEYSLTKPSIYLITSKKNKKEEIDLGREFYNYKQDFQNHIHKKNKTESKAEFEWKEHIYSKLEFMKQFFFSEAEKRDIKNPEKLWEEYKKKIVME